MKGNEVLSINLKEIKIGILGAPINNLNMGCLALTYSLLSVLEDISKELNIQFTYYDFEGVKDYEKCQVLCRNLRIDEKRVKSYNIYPVESFLGFCHRPIKAVETFLALNQCDMFIDLTQGDSFTDIYGNTVFSKNANGKFIVETILHKPLILGPQTYGPFLKEKNQKKAKMILEKAQLVIARDDMSREYTKCFTDKEVFTTTDLAFKLPYCISEKTPSKTIKIGLNISGLLVEEKTELTPTQFKLRTNYDEYIDKLLAWMTQRNYEIWLISHVLADYVSCSRYVKKYSSVHLASVCSDPVSIKSFIATMDIFIGARMHATIASFSSGVATIPTAYSRKFNGIYESIGYPYLIDLLNCGIEENLQKTIYYIEIFGQMKECMDKCSEQVNKKNNETYHLLRNIISDIICPQK